MHRNQVTTLLGLAALMTGLFAATPEPAHARRGIAVINTGEDYFATGPLPAPFDEVPELAGYQAGYKCSIFGLFWAYGAWWDCEPVAFNEDSFLNDPELVAAISAEYTQDDMQVGFWRGQMRWVVLALLLAVAGFFGWAVLTSKDDDEDEAGSEPVSDAR